MYRKKVNIEHYSHLFLPLRQSFHWPETCPFTLHGCSMNCLDPCACVLPSLVTKNTCLHSLWVGSTLEPCGAGWSRSGVEWWAVVRSNSVQPWGPPLQSGKSEDHPSSCPSPACPSIRKESCAPQPLFKLPSPYIIKFSKYLGFIFMQIAPLIIANDVHLLLKPLSTSLNLNSLYSL